MLRFTSKKKNWELHIGRNWRRKSSPHNVSRWKCKNLITVINLSAYLSYLWCVTLIGSQSLTWHVNDFRERRNGWHLLNERRLSSRRDAADWQFIEIFICCYHSTWSKLPSCSVPKFTTQRPCATKSNERQQQQTWTWMVRKATLRWW